MNVKRSQCYSRYRLPLYAYPIHRTGTFIFLYSNLATPLFPNSTPLFHIHLQTSLFLLMTHLYSDIYDAFIISSYNSSLSTNTYNPCSQQYKYSPVLSSRTLSSTSCCLLSFSINLQLLLTSYTLQSNCLAEVLKPRVVAQHSSSTIASNTKSYFIV